MVDEGNGSLVLMIKYRETSFIFTGDMEQEQESLICDSYGDDKEWNVSLLKVAHHGSKTSTSYRFVRMLMPDYAVISVGKNSYGHPSEQTLSRLDQANVKKVYRTDRSGNIVVDVISGGRELRVTPSR